MINKSRNSVTKLFLLLLVFLACLDFGLCLADTSKLGKKCVTTDDCNAPYILCDDGTCRRKPLFPMTGEEIGSLILLIILCVISMACTLSGGLVMVPLTMIMIGFSAKQAVTFSNAVILLTAFAKYVLAFFKKNPEVPFKTIIDYNAAISMIPSISLFSIFGGIITAFLPDLLITVLLIALVILAITLGLIQIRMMLKRQKVKSQQDKSPNDGKSQVMKTEEEMPIPSSERKFTLALPNSTGTEMTKTHKDNVETVDTPAQANTTSATVALFALSPNVNQPEDPNKDEIEKQKVIDGKNFDFVKFPVIALVLVLTVLITLFRGGKEVKSIIGIPMCSGGDWGLLAAYTVLMIILHLYSYFVITKEQVLRERIHFEKADPSRVVITKKMFWMTTFWSGFTGFITTITGLGGGVLLTPYFVWMNYSAVSASWTINLMVLLSKVAAIVVAVLAGQFLTDYVFFYGGLITVAMVIAENTLLILLKKLKSQVIILSGFVLILVISLIMNAYIGIQDGINKKNK